MPIINFKNLTLGFNHKQLLHQFNHTLGNNEFIGVFGANGAGKSTLLRAILGLVEPVSGCIEIDGDVTRRGHPDIGYMPQLKSNPSFHQLTGRAYLGITLNGLGWGVSSSGKQQQKKIAEAIELTGLQEYVDQPYEQLSGGERQRLALAQALLNHPKILLLDEPLSCLDPGQQLRMVSLIHSLQCQLNMTVLLTAHDINPLLNVMTNVIYLAQGKATVGSVVEVINSKTLSSLYEMPIGFINKHAALDIYNVDHTIYQ